MFRSPGLRKSVEQPVLDLNFAAAGALDSRITFSRGTSATFVGSNGLIQTAGNNVARFDYDPVTNTPRGLLIEEARTNLAPSSHEFNASTGTTRSADAHTAPDGTTTADEFTISSSNESHQITNLGLAGSDVTTGTVHAVSFFAKLINGTPNIGVRGFGKGGLNTFPIFDLNAGTVVNVGSAWESGTAIESFGNGWFRCKCVVNPSSQFSTLIHFLASGDTNGTGTFTGNGTDKVAVWGGQLEVGSFVTSHIATTGSAATRNADVATMGPTNSKPFEGYNTAEGTIFMEGSVPFTPQATDFTALVRLEGADPNNDRIDLRLNSLPQLATLVKVSGSNTQTQGVNNVDADEVFRFGLAFKEDSFVAASSQKLAVGIDNSGAIPTIQKMSLVPIDEYPNAGHFKRILYFNRRISDNHLQSMMDPYQL